MAGNFTRRLKLSAALGTAAFLGFPLAAQASTPTTSSPLGPLQTSQVATVTKAVSTTPLAAPVTRALTPAAGTQTQTGTAAPKGSAEAYAAEVAGIVGISHTSATASGTGTSSTADPLEIGGKPPAAQLGGTQNGPGASSNALLDTGPNSQLRLELTPWSATNTESGGQNHASAIADIVVLDLGDQTTAESASLRVLQSTSDATWNSAASSGSSSSDGAILTAGGPSGVNIDILHSDANSSGTGSSYLISINGNEIGSSGQVNGQCALSIPSLLSLDCLTASGGTAGGITSETSGVLSVILGTPPAGATVGLIQSSTSSGAAPSPSVESGSGGQQGSSGGQSGVQPSVAASSAPSAGSGALAFTGGNFLTSLIAALLLGLIGACLLWATRRRRAGTI